MVVLKSVKVESSKKSSELLVLGRFKNVDIKKTISFLSLEDKNINLYGYKCAICLIALPTIPVPPVIKHIFI